jgi:uncharacterized protein involved in type VI secretion and phage assembly
MTGLLDLGRAEARCDERLADGLGGRWYGVAPALVTDIKDPDGQGRVKVKLPWAPDGGGGPGYEAWARIATLFAGGKRGSWFIPDVDDEVLVAFEHGDPRRPTSSAASGTAATSPPKAWTAAAATTRR